MVIQDMLNILGVRPDDMNTVRIAVTCLLRNEGGWWSTDCIIQHLAVRVVIGNSATSMLVRLALAEMALEGHAATRPSNCGLLYSYTE